MEMFVIPACLAESIIITRVSTLEELWGWIMTEAAGFSAFSWSIFDLTWVAIIGRGLPLRIISLFCPISNRMFLFSSSGGGRSVLSLSLLAALIAVSDRNVAVTTKKINKMKITSIMDVVLVAMAVADSSPDASWIRSPEERNVSNRLFTV